MRVLEKTVSCSYCHTLLAYTTEDLLYNFGYYKSWQDLKGKWRNHIIRCIECPECRKIIDLDILENVNHRNTDLTLEEFLETYKDKLIPALRNYKKENDQ